MTRLKYALYTFAMFLCTNGLYADEEADMPPRDQGMWQTLVMLGIVVVFFYFILWRPEQKRRKELEAKRGALQQGDRVQAMGIIGTVVRVQEQTVILKMYDGTKLEFLKGAISEVIPTTDEDKKKVAKDTE